MAWLAERLDFRDGRARYEENREEHHHHLIDVNSGEVIEFKNDELEAIKRKIASELGYDIIGDRLELYGVKKEGVKDKTQAGPKVVAKKG